MELYLRLRAQTLRGFFDKLARAVTHSQPGLLVFSQR